MKAFMWFCDLCLFFFLWNVIGPIPAILIQGGFIFYQLISRGQKMTAVKAIIGDKSSNDAQKDYALRKLLGDYEFEKLEREAKKLQDLR
jgi:hypothetical protein